MMRKLKGKNRGKNFGYLNHHHIYDVALYKMLSITTRMTIIQLEEDDVDD